jgi:hypothetical protein
MEIEPFRQINLLPDIASGAKPPAPRMYRQAMIKDRDNNIYAVYGDRLKKGTPDDNTGPWDINIIGTDKLKVVPGLLCGILPSNWDEEFSFSGTGLVYAVAKIQTDGTAINSVQISISSTAPQNQKPEKWKLPSSVEYLFALINKGEVKRVIGAGDITIGPKIWVTVPKDQAVGPGELAYDRYYILA